MSRITINGVTVVGGRFLSIRNEKVFVDGADVTPESKEINITINGNVERLEADACSKISVIGDVGAIKTLSGDVDITGAISGSVQTMSGDVDCGGSIAGSVTSMSGAIRHR